MSKEADNWTGCYEGGWQGLIVPGAFAHPAKFSYKLTERMVSHAIRNGWITKGSVVVDPFGGVGCGGIVAAYNDLVWIGVELEEKFVDLGRLNFGLHQGKLAALGCPQPKIILGDSRKLCEVLESADIIISSPPYEGSEGTPSAGKLMSASGGTCSSKAQKELNMTAKYGSTPGQLGSMKPGQVDAVISSPPFTGESQGVPSGIGSGGPIKRAEQKAAGYGAALEGYGNTPGNLGNLKPGDVDCVVSSPPYEGSMTGNNVNPDEVAKRKTKHSQCGGTWETPGRKRAYAAMMSGYNPDNKDNLGNDKGDTFWQAAREILQQCHQILKPGGHAIKDGENIDFCDCE